MENNRNIGSPRFLLYGIGGVYNYGCEAIVRGTEIMLREVWPDAIIKYASVRLEDDAQRLKDTRIEIVPRIQYSRYSLRNICRKAASMARLSWVPIMEKLDFITDSDVVLSIGGDLYALHPNGRYNSRLMKLGELIIRRGKKFIIWGASIGPFDKNRHAEIIFRKHLNKVHLITSREPASTDYLQAIGVQKNVISCADPAYAVSPEIFQSVRPNNHLCIGINLSPLSVRHSMPGRDLKSICAEQAKTIVALVKGLDAHVVLIPHVICDFNENDDDLRYQQSIVNALPKDVASHVEIYDRDLGFLDAKMQIIKCHLILAARMHCAINALAAGVPTILISYSQKAIGMAKYIYGNKRWVIPLQEFNSTTVLDLVQKILAEDQSIRNHLKNRLPEIQKDVRKGAIALANLCA